MNMRQCPNHRIVDAPSDAELSSDTQILLAVRLCAVAGVSSSGVISRPDDESESNSGVGSLDVVFAGITVFNTRSSLAKSESYFSCWFRSWSLSSCCCTLCSSCSSRNWHSKRFLSDIALRVCSSQDAVRVFAAAVSERACLTRSSASLHLAFALWTSCTS